MILSVKDRLMLLDVLPKTGDLITLQISQRAATAVSLTQDDIDTFGITSGDGAVRWDESKDTGVEVEIEPAAVDLVAKELKSMNEKRTLTIDHLGLCSKFLQ
jgi:hypothetical protein